MLVDIVLWTYFKKGNIGPMPNREKDRTVSTVTPKLVRVGGCLSAARFPPLLGGKPVDTTDAEERKEVFRRALRQSSWVQVDPISQTTAV